MKNILVIGACGQIGSELTPTLRGIYGTDHVVAADCVYPLKGALAESGPSCKIDATCAEHLANAVQNIILILFLTWQLFFLLKRKQIRC